ncbi:MAG: dipeptidase PepV [Methanomicrobiales archaeon]
MSLKKSNIYSVFDRLIEQDSQQLTESVRSITKIRSVAGDPEPGKPCGQGPASALQATLEIARSMKFFSENLDNYIGFVEYGEGEDYIAVLGHLDTVPEGDHWTFPPFSATVHENRIYGRGVLDDKGPILSALYSLKAIRDSGVPLTRRIRVIFGTDEETGDLDITQYLSREKPPVCGFTPDSDFPVVFAEMGILQVNFTRKISFDCRNSSKDFLVSFNGGEAVNMVPDRAAAEIRTRNPLEIIRKCKEFSQVSGFMIAAEANGDLIIIRSAGVSAHGSKPQLGKNAIMQVVSFLSTLQLDPPEASRMVRFLEERIGMETSGVLFGLDMADQPSGHLTLNAGVIRYGGRNFTLSVDIRYPVTDTFDNVMEHIQKSLKDQEILTSIRKHQPPLYYPPGSDLISTLSTIYHDMTGDPGEPVAIGGGTYARKVPGMVAFGPYFPGKTNNIHAADESIGCDELITIAKIYARAMYSLAT